jgi:excinuclease ABC subunit C
MGEVLRRRMAAYLRQKEISPHDDDYDESFASLPGLIVIDGGKGQLSAAYEALRALGLERLIAVGLAKQEELIFTRDSFEPIALPRESAALRLLQRIRDEAHRFAVTYHQKVRARRAIRSILDDVAGVGPARKRALLRKFGSVRAMQEAPVEDLAAVGGVGPALAERIKQALSS